MAFYKNGNYKEALSAWRILLRKHPVSDTLIYFTAIAYQANGDDAHAEAYLSILAQKIRSAFYKKACWYLGLYFLKIGKISEAAEYVRLSTHANSLILAETITSWQQ